jgi:hypothetical protein
LGGLVPDQEEVEGEGSVVRVRVEPGFAEASALAALVDGDDAVAFVVQAAGLDEAMAAGVVQAGEVALLEVGEGRGEFVRMFLFVGARARG